MFYLAKWERSSILIIMNDTNYQQNEQYEAHNEDDNENLKYQKWKY